MKTYKISIVSILILLVLAGCSDRKKYFEDERYEKMVYIVSDKDNIHNLVYDLDGKDNNIRYLSIACSGTNPTEEEATITLTEDTVLLDEYNYTNFVEDKSRYAIKMNAEDFKIESNNIKYSIGQPYTLVPINIDMSVIESLNPDKTYFIPIAIKDATLTLWIKKKGNVLLQIHRKNKYTSTADPVSYNASGYEGNGYFLISKTMVPLTKNQVRVNIGTKRLPAEPENQPDFIKKNTVIIEVADDNSLTVKPYDSEEMEVETVDVKVAHPGDNAYALYNNRLDPTTTTFCVCYKYRLKTGSWTEVREAIRLPVIVIE